MINQNVLSSIYGTVYPFLLIEMLPLSYTKFLHILEPTLMLSILFYLLACLICTVYHQIALL